MNELTRQCEMAWKRGFQFGVVIGGVVMITACGVIYLLGSVMG